MKVTSQKKMQIKCGQFWDMWRQKPQGLNMNRSLDWILEEKL